MAILFRPFCFIAPKTLNYLASQSFDFEPTLWWLFQKRVVRTKSDNYVFISYTTIVNEFKKKKKKAKAQKTWYFRKKPEVWLSDSVGLELSFPSSLSQCLYNYEFWLSLCKIVRSSLYLLLPLFSRIRYLLECGFKNQQFLYIYIRNIYATSWEWIYAWYNEISCVESTYQREDYIQVSYGFT